MRKYEVMYIIRPDVEQEVVQATVEKFRDGVYVLVNFTAEPAVVTELERLMKISDEVIRYLITNDVKSA